MNGDVPPQNGGEFIQSQYLWGKTYRVEIVDKDIVIDTVAPEWLFVNRCKKLWQGRISYGEQVLFIYAKFANNTNYDWNKDLIESIAKRHDLPEKARQTSWITNRVTAGDVSLENENLSDFSLDRE